MNIEIDRTLCAAIKRAVADEYISGQLYTLWSLAAKPEAKQAVAGLFAPIADDELRNHMASLIEWCAQAGCDTPCTEAEIKRSASANSRKMLQSMKKGQDALYYLQLASKHEQALILQYRRILEHDQVSQFTDLQSILWNIYYDEEEHLRKIKTAIIACQADMQMDLIIQ